ncbi:MAG TPA: ankyrin repeat domain-containing protein [Candidatus Hydrogenedentes bacterium]|nr:ankyrin repeat domain-containing protein [Candidatus Hydrogenedentota bacterium]
MHRAVTSGNVVAVEALLRAGADVNQKDWFGKTPLHHAIIHSEILAPLLIQNGAQVNQADALGCTPLHYAVMAGDDSPESTSVELLIENGADVNAKNNADRTPLYWARRYSDLLLLVNHGTDVNNVDLDGETFLHFLLKREEIANPCIEDSVASEVGKANRDMLMRLLRGGARLDIKNKSGVTAASLALDRGIVCAPEFGAVNGVPLNDATDE